MITRSQLATLGIVSAKLNQNKQEGVRYEVRLVIFKDGSGKVEGFWTNTFHQWGTFDMAEFLDEKGIDQALIDAQVHADNLMSTWGQLKEFAASLKDENGEQ